MAIAHTVLPVIISILIYINFYLLGTKLFNDKKKETWIFLIFINLIYIFGDFSLRTNFRFELVRLWQGKAVLGNLLIPSLIVVYDSFIQGETKFPYWISVFITMWASCLVSTMGFALAPIMLAGLTIVYWFRAINIGWPVKKELVRKTRNDLLKIGIKSVICCIPNFVYAIMYAIMKGGTTNG
jgi:hypothetical protein